MNPATAPGPGDSATWPACAGHPNDPRTDDTDPPLSEDDAMEEAERRITCSPASILYHLVQLCEGGAEALSTSELFSRDFDPDAATSDTLLVMAFNGSDDNRRLARYVLTQRLADAMRDDIKREAEELLDADAKAREQEEA